MLNGGLECTARIRSVYNLPHLLGALRQPQKKCVKQLPVSVTSCWSGSQGTLSHIVGTAVLSLRETLRRQKRGSGNGKETGCRVIFERQK